MSAGDTYDSCTTSCYLQVIEDFLGNEVKVIDTPGVCDTKGPEHDLKQALSLTRTLHSLKSARILLTLQREAIDPSPAARGMARHIFTNIIKTLKDLLKGNAALLPSVGVVITQAEVDDDHRTLLEDLKQLRELFAGTKTTPGEYPKGSFGYQAITHFFKFLNNADRNVVFAKPMENTPETIAAFVKMMENLNRVNAPQNALGAPMFPESRNALRQACERAQHNVLDILHREGVIYLLLLNNCK